MRYTMKFNTRVICFIFDTDLMVSLFQTLYRFVISLQVPFTRHRADDYRVKFYEKCRAFPTPDANYT